MDDVISFDVKLTYLPIFEEERFRSTCVFTVLSNDTCAFLPRCILYLLYIGLTSLLVWLLRGDSMAYVKLTLEK